MKAKPFHIIAWIVFLVAISLIVLKVSRPKDPDHERRDTIEISEEDIELEPEREVIPTDQSGKDSYEITFTNTSSEFTLSPGVFIAHDSSISLDYQNTAAPGALESLTEYGNNNAFFYFVQDLPSVHVTLRLDNPIGPGESVSETISVPDNSVLSGAQMVVQSNDGFAFLDAAPLSRRGVYDTLNLDGGTEENSPLFSGFSGGQPDPEQGEANEQNGVATIPPEHVAPHEQLQSSILQVTIDPLR